MLLISRLGRILSLSIVAIAVSPLASTALTPPEGDPRAEQRVTSPATPAAAPPTLPTPSFLIAQESEDLVNVSLPNFLPSTMGFSFSNEDLTNAIKGDPYLTNWGSFVEEATRQDQASNYEGYWSKVLHWLFYSDVCMNPNSTRDECVLNIPSRRWLQRQLAAMARGMCEGMATASLYAWDATINPNQEPRNYLYTDLIYEYFEDEDRFIGFLDIGEELPFDLTVSAGDTEGYHFFVKTFMAELFMLQNLDEVKEKTELSRSTPPSELLQELIRSIGGYQGDADSFQNLSVIGIYRHEPQTDTLTDGHTLTPYAVREMPDGTFQVAVYDSNAPGRDDLYMVFEGDTWRYAPPDGQPYTGDASTGSLDLTPLRSRFLPSEGYFDCPFCAGDDPSTDVFVDGDAALTVINYRDGQMVQAASRAAQGGLGLEPPASFNLASGEDLYLLTLAGEDGRPVQNASLVTLGSGFSLGVEGVSLPTAEAQLLVFQTQIDGRPTIIVQSDATQTISLPRLFVAIEEVDSNGIANSYQFELYDIQIPPNRAVFASVDLEGRDLYFGDNDGEPDSYNFYVRFISGEYATNVASDGSDAAYFDRDGFWVDVEEVPYGGSQFGVFEYGTWADSGTTESTEWIGELPLFSGEYDDTAIVNLEQLDVGPLLNWLGFNFEDSTTQDAAWNAPAIQPLSEGSRGRTSSQRKGG
ncbi:MAG: hypothetical protein OHK0037_07950 [Elainellaceae cyanobacterium]